MKKNKLFLDLFAGAGGLSEGFISAGFKPLAHVEVDPAACNTLKTRMAYHYLKDEGKLSIYNEYLHRKITRKELYNSVPDTVINSVINKAIGTENNEEIYKSVDSLLNGRKLDLIVGGPPCQAYSVVGRSRDKNKMKGDSRNYLYKYYAEFLKRYQPKYFVFENVLGLKSAKNKDGVAYFDMMTQLFKEAGYKTEFKILNAKDYGVLQNRRRIILIGKLNGKENFYPEPEMWNPSVTVGEILNDLPELQAGEGTDGPCKTKKNKNKYLVESGIRSDDLPVTWHIARPHTLQDKEIYKIAVSNWSNGKRRLDYNDLPDRLITHKNRHSFTDRFKVVANDLTYSHTVVAHIAKDGHYYIHPDINQNRSLTPREAARLQTFPDDYYFEGVSEKPSRTAAFKQIGNAVPVLLGKRIADKLMEIL
jgi:DNA (cytosine-5)-methyltransferase 1